ncbi:diguanylate cyclase [Pseudomonas sp. p99-361]|nr:diguanylate cyclase [Pseudomonas aeruginosa]QEQ86357.1 diguanylate cyclase [Pseudomonas putida]RRV23141.1 diguanylate cyclase [Pseudomonas sp. p99-361]
MGAGVPANTGAAGARHRVACFAGTPAPTMDRAGFSNFEKDS